MSHQRRDGEYRKLPAWLIGLVIAAALFALGLIVFQALGFGDDPVIDPNAFAEVWESGHRLWAA